MDESLKKTIEECDLETLVNVKDFVEKQITKAKKKSMKDAKKMVVDHLKKKGFTPEEIFGTGNEDSSKPDQEPKQRKPSNAPPMYIDPENPENTWHGKGGEQMLPTWAKKKNLTREKIKKNKKFQNPAYLEFKQKTDPNWVYPSS